MLYDISSIIEHNLTEIHICYQKYQICTFKKWGHFFDEKKAPAGILPVAPNS